MSSINELADEDVTLFRKDMDGNMEKLKESLDSLYEERDRNFAENLCSFYENNGYLSSKQLMYAVRFFFDAGNSLDGTVKSQKNPAKKQELSPPRVVVNGAPLVQMFELAAQFIQKPKIVYKVVPPVDGVENLVFYRTGDKSHAPGSVGVVNGSQYPDNCMLATIYKSRPASFYRNVFGKPAIQQLIKKIAENPKEQLKFNGLEHQHCCYCSQRLTDPRSILAGYGPICADKWGLPWGDEIPQVQPRLQGV
jgi:hypothetical protein